MAQVLVGSDKLIILMLVHILESNCMDGEK